MNIGHYRINLDALFARIIYRWRVRSIAAAVLLVVLAGLTSGLIPPFWRGRASLAISAAPGAVLQVDGKLWPHAIYAGRHSVVATLPDGRRAWADIGLQASQALTITLPVGLPEPRVRTLPAAAPDMHIDHVWWADGAWRITSVRNAPVEIPTPARSEPAEVSRPSQTVAISAQNADRLSTLDAYAGLADQVHAGSNLIEAVYRPRDSRSFGDAAGGTIEVRGWNAAAQTVPISAALTLLRFSPDGATLLEAEQVPGGEQVYALTRGRERAPVVAVPGRITRLSWQPDGRAVVIHSIQGGRLTLTLARLAPTVMAATIADMPAAAYSASIVPLTWDGAGFLWIAPDHQGSSTLWRAPLQSLIPERVRPMDARAVSCRSDGTLRAAVVQGDQVVLGRYQGDLFIGETVVPDVPGTPDLMGIWQDNQLLLQNSEGAWLLDIDEEG